MATYTWNTPPEAGIIRLIVLPYCDQNGDGIYTGEGDVAPDTRDSAGSGGGDCSGGGGRG